MLCLVWHNGSDSKRLLHGQHHNLAGLHPKVITSHGYLYHRGGLSCGEWEDVKNFEGVSNAVDDVPVWVKYCIWVI